MAKKKNTYVTVARDKGICGYNDVWVAYRRGATDIDKIYLKKEDAEAAGDEYMKEVFDYYRELHKRMTDEEFKEYFDAIYPNGYMKVMYLDSAIDAIKEIVDENAREVGEEY